MNVKKSIILLVTGILFGVLLTYSLMKDKDDALDTEVRHNMVLTQVEKLGNLEVVRYNIQDVMEYKKIRRWLPNAKTALVVAGEVIGCIDLTKISKEDLLVFGDSLHITLPAPEICHVRVDHSRSRIFNIEYALWESTEIADDAYRQAEKQLQEEALKLDLSAKGRENATQVLKPILLSLGFNHVNISFQANKNTDGR